MLRLLRWLFTGDGHIHQWEFYTYVDIRDYGRLIGRKSVYKCKVCGKFKRETICEV
jgi:hypothetical protein